MQWCDANGVAANADQTFVCYEKKLTQERLLEAPGSYTGADRLYVHIANDTRCAADEATTSIGPEIAIGSPFRFCHLNPSERMRHMATTCGSASIMGAPLAVEMAKPYWTFRLPTKSSALA